ncbi:MAG TPA: hypothetical protein VKA84_16595 [Gemmatimonadaceae bacterium]|nr:hypothetical protein [Gemmatimonadaceae bacterium]
MSRDRKHPSNAEFESPPAPGAAGAGSTARSLRQPAGAAEAADPATGIDRVRARHESRLLSMDGVVGVGLGRTSAGADVILVYVRDRAACDTLPGSLDGVPIEGIVTGTIRAR